MRYWSRFWKWFTRPYRVAKAKKDHYALICEARENWTCLDTYKVRVIDGQKKKEGEDITLGWNIYGAYSNDLGERQVRIIHECRYADPLRHETWAKLKEWEAKAERKSIPFQEVL